MSDIPARVNKIMPAAF